MKVEAASGVEPAAAGSGLQRGCKTGERGTFHTRLCSAQRNEEPSAQRWDGWSGAGTGWPGAEAENLQKPLPQLGLPKMPWGRPAPTVSTPPAEVCAVSLTQRRAGVELPSNRSVCQIQQVTNQNQPTRGMMAPERRSSVTVSTLAG